jgi:sec-independent protein translocase protein TatA
MGIKNFHVYLHKNYKTMNIITFLGVVGPWQVVLIVLAIVLLFGGKKIPELMRGLGKGVKSFKDGVNGINDEINQTDNQDKQR